MRIQYIVGENKEKVGEVMISIIQKPAGFKIRRKGDVETFKNVCLCNGSKYIIKINPNYIFMLEKTENNITGTIKQGDLFNIFNPEIQIDADKWVWKLRKYINKNILDSSLLTCVVLLRPEFKPFVGTIQLVINGCQLSFEVCVSAFNFLSFTLITNNIID